MIDSRPIAEGLFSWPSEEPHLIGSRCDACGLVVFPTAEFCVKCSQQRLSDIELGRRGTLWTFTTQQFRPRPRPMRATNCSSHLGLDTWPLRANAWWRPG